MWSTSAWRSSCKSHTPLRDRLWPPVCPNHGRGRVSAPPSGSEPDLGQFHGPYRGRKEKQDKGRGRRGRLRPVTSARSAGSYGGFGCIKSGVKIRSVLSLGRSLSPNAYCHNKKTGVTRVSFAARDILFGLDAPSRFASHETKIEILPGAGKCDA